MKLFILIPTICIALDFIGCSSIKSGCQKATLEGRSRGRGTLCWYSDVALNEHLAKKPKGEDIELDKAMIPKGGRFVLTWRFRMISSNYSFSGSQRDPADPVPVELIVIDPAGKQKRCGEYGNGYDAAGSESEAELSCDLNRPPFYNAKVVVMDAQGFELQTYIFKKPE